MIERFHTLLSIATCAAISWLADSIQDRRYIITNQVVNNTPVWAFENGGWKRMYRSNDGQTWIGSDTDCADGISSGMLYNTAPNPEFLAPSQLPLDKWASSRVATLEPQWTSAVTTAVRLFPAGRWGSNRMIYVPSMRVTAVHGLDDGHPAMFAALRQLAALADDV